MFSGIGGFAYATEEVWDDDETGLYEDFVAALGLTYELLKTRTEQELEANKPSKPETVIMSKEVGEA